MEQIRGQIERITYSNEENSYAVIKVRVYNHNDLVTAVGNIIGVSPGEIIFMSGEWIQHSKFGEQFKVICYISEVPDTIVGIEKYLGSGLIKGIGPIMSKRIVRVFKEKTLDIIEHDPEKLLGVEGVGEYRVTLIKEAWKEQKEIRSVMIFLQSHGVSSIYSSKIYKQYGKDSIKVVNENPYRLAHDIWGIGFFTADKIAKQMGFNEESSLRAEAGIMHILYENTDKGHVYMPVKEALSKTEQLLEVRNEVIKTAMENLEKKNKIITEQLVKDEDAKEIEGVFLAGYHMSEIQISRMLKAIKNNKGQLTKITEKEEIIRTAPFNLAEKQIKAIETGIKEKVVIITGGPGTGKTTITNIILKLISKETERIILAAPTGRAAKRMAESTGRESKTIHRLLEYNPVEAGFKKNENNKLECDLLVLDEASMIDNLLMYHLLKAMPNESKLILIGDVNQLPSVGAGNVLKDIINSKQFKVIELNEIFRQAQESKIIVNAHKIINGEFPNIVNDKDTDFYFLEESDEDRILEKIAIIVSERLPKHFGYNPLRDIQVLTPMNRGKVGTTMLNEKLQKVLGMSKIEVSRGCRRFRLFDKVMQIKNNYDKNVYNGDIGFITDIDLEEQKVKVTIDDKEIYYEYNELDELILAYAISIHKSQGSEYPAVVIPVVISHYVMLQRNLIYTGITRGKSKVVLIGSKKALSIAVKNNKAIERNTWLCERLKNS